MKISGGFSSEMGSGGDVLVPPPCDYGPNLKVIPKNDQIKELQTILRDK